MWLCRGAWGRWLTALTLTMKPPFSLGQEFLCKLCCWGRGLDRTDLPPFRNSGSSGNSFSL